MHPAELLDLAAPRGSPMRQLACLASLAVRVDAPLLRHLRLALVPAATVATELDLWFSDLSESRDHQCMIFDAEVAALLRTELARQALPDGRWMLDAAHALLAELHAQSAAAHRREETLTYLGLCASSGRVPAIDSDTLLAPALAAMASSPERAREVARWAQRALPRLPAPAQQSEAAITLELAAALHLDMPLTLPAEGHARALPDDLAWLVPEGSRAAQQELACEVLGNALVLHKPAESNRLLPRITLPHSRPLLLELQVFAAADAGHDRRVQLHTHALRPGQALPLPPGWTRLELRSLLGQGWQIVRSQAAASKPPDAQKLCYVVMGFGEKTDYKTSRVLDLNKTYRYIIKKAVEDAGLKCLRADELPHGGTNDVPMFEMLLDADLVIADLSTSNLNAAYELGVRHALKPASTIVIAETQFDSPFDVNHIPIRKYRHDGKALDIDEVDSFRAKLTQAIQDVMANGRIDSPVYTFLQLQPPERRKEHPERLIPAASQQPPAEAAVPEPKVRTETGTCFVTMGFGEKIDYKTSRRLDLDKSYRHIIKRAVEDAGLKCIRADEIPHAGTIDMPRYEMLLDAHLVIADLSASNLSAAYELGIRHALRPATTIVIAESQFNSPFDVNQFPIRKYQHDGQSLDVNEVEQFRASLTQAIHDVMASGRADSPVYTFLPLQPPTRHSATSDTAQPGAPESGPAGESLADLMEQARDCKAKGDWATAKTLLTQARAIAPNDVYVVQQLALVTYKSRQPNAVRALHEARTILETLNPMSVNDAETLGLWGAIHKRLFDATGEADALDVAVQAYAKGFSLLNDYYNGINYAFLLNLRAARQAGQAAASEDSELAETVRRTVAAICTARLQALKDTPENRSERYWILATQAEAALGDGLPDAEARCQALLEQARQFSEAEFMWTATMEQLDRLRRLLDTVPPAATAAA